MGSKKNSIWRVVVADGRSPRDGRFIERVGHYNPQSEPSQIVLDRERLEHWIAKGAKPSNTVLKLMKAEARAAAVPAAVATEAAAEATEDARAEGSAPEEPSAEGAAAAEAAPDVPPEGADVDASS